MAPRLTTAHIADFLHGRATRPKLVGDDTLGIAAALDRFSEEFQDGGLIPGLCDTNLQNLAFLANRAPQVVRFAGYAAKSRSSTLAPLTMPVSSIPVFLTSPPELADAGPLRKSRSIRQSKYRRSVDCMEAG